MLLMPKECCHRPVGDGELLLPLFWPFPVPTEPTPLLLPLTPAVFPLPLKFPFPAPTAPAPFPIPLVPPVLLCPFPTPLTGGGGGGGELAPPPPPPFPPPVKAPVEPLTDGGPCGVFVSRPRAFPTLLSTRLYELTEPFVGKVTVSCWQPAAFVFCTDPCPECMQGSRQTRGLMCPLSGLNLGHNDGSCHAEPAVG